MELNNLIWNKYCESRQYDIGLEYTPVLEDLVEVKQQKYAVLHNQKMKSGWRVSDQSIFHKYIVCHKKENKVKIGLQKPQLSMKNDQKKVSPSGIHLCRIIQIEKDLLSEWPLCVMKRVAIWTNFDMKKEDQRTLNTHTKTLSQIRTQMMVFEKMSESHRCIKLYQTLIENPKRKSDDNFFYKHLKLNKIKGIQNGCFFIQYCNEGDLDRKIQNFSSKFNQEEIIRLSSQIIEGLNELKDKGILHRDLRTCNIFIHDGQIKFADFDSAFIENISQPCDIRTGIDIDTTPPQIIELTSKSDEELEIIGSSKLFQMQSKCDIYFFGMALFKMIFLRDYHKSYDGTIMQYFIKEKKNQGFRLDLLLIMKDCLISSVEKRIQLKNLNQRFMKVQQEIYYLDTSNKRTYLSKDPLTSFENQYKIDEDIIFKIPHPKEKQILTKKLLLHYKTQFERSEVNRLTQIYKQKLQNKICQLDQIDEKLYLSIWQVDKQEQEKRKNYRQEVRIFIEGFQIWAYYYDFLYKVILRIDLRSIRSKQHLQVMKENKKIIQQKLVIILSFILGMLCKMPFKNDNRYQEDNLQYEVRQLLKSIPQILNKSFFFQGKCKLFDYQNNPIYKQLQTFFIKEYQQESHQNFSHLFQQITQSLKKVQIILQQNLIQTICDFINSYQNYENEKVNLREILLILVVLSKYSPSTITKKQLIKLKTIIFPILNGQNMIIEQAEVFFTQFQNINKIQQLKSYYKIEQNKDIHPSSQSIKLKDPLPDVYYQDYN